MRNLEEIVKEYVAIEMCEGSHSKNIDEYDNELDFYLENVTNSEGTYETYLANSLSKEELNHYGVIEVWNAIEQGIREAVWKRR
ncbi:hypothetical protein CO726_30460 [Bacillus fungorum]|uniref:Uncharacterized protein n=1 Tax=Bacillus fungorum TaxID=2039284 RepID=A0A2G6Q4L5_9BACI|nr:hypothetical protein [Bacillus fungorum]PIE91751.1 hypothetical protein CO726_30460 [Bacillus fungorum]